MKVLVACEFSATVRDAFRKQGADAWSCDLLPCEKDPQWHIQGDVIPVLSQGWDLMIGHPTCTFLCNSGVSWLRKEPTRWNNMVEGAQFFLTLWNAPIRSIALENPIMHGYAKDIVKMEPTQIIQPYQFGHPESKGTCLWLKGLPLLKSTSLFGGKEQRLHKLPPSANRWRERSRTYQGIADAMAEQWTAFLQHFQKYAK
jgi:hypothetical protein